MESVGNIVGVQDDAVVSNGAEVPSYGVGTRVGSCVGTIVGHRDGTSEGYRVGTSVGSTLPVEGSELGL